MKSRKIAIATTGSLGDLHPAMALAFGLRARGYQIVFATSEIYRAKIEQAGINYHLLRPDLPEDRETIAKITHPTQGAEFLFRRILLTALSETYADLIEIVADCDLLIANGLILPASIVAEKIGIPWILYELQPTSFFSIYDPPVLESAPFLAKSKFLGTWVVSLFKQLVKSITRSWAEPIHQLRKELELPDVSHPIFFEGKFTADLVLAMFDSVFAQKQPDWAKQTKITGFTFYDRLTSNSGLSTQLQSFLAAGEAPIVFTLGSSAVKTPGNFYSESLAVVEQLGCRAVFLVGDTILDNLPDRAIAVDYAPYSELFPRAKAIVHQGGIGTTAQALRAGVPMLVVPFSLDQPDNAARVVRLGVGRTISRKNYRQNSILKELQLLLNDARYKIKAMEIAEIIQAEDGVKTACDAIEALLPDT
ncbi:MAG: glycosyltransferase [Pleurocapsa sp. MO_226.B13]|nr:glycosyltransferase [Pleurocapsa sp. MO_226.B13]